MSPPIREARRGKAGHSDDQGAGERSRPIAEGCPRHPDDYFARHDEACLACGQERVDARMVELRAELVERGLVPGGVVVPPPTVTP